jgi:hypothetical protein
MNPDDPVVGFKICYRIDPKLSGSEEDALSCAFIMEAIIEGKQGHRR